MSTLPRVEGIRRDGDVWHRILCDVVKGSPVPNSGTGYAIRGFTTNLIEISASRWKPVCCERSHPFRRSFSHQDDLVDFPIGAFGVEKRRALQFVRAAHLNLPLADTARLRLYKEGRCRAPRIKRRCDAVRCNARCAHDTHRVNWHGGVEIVDSTRFKEVAIDINILKDGGILKSGLRYRHAPDDGDVVFRNPVSIPVGCSKHLSGGLEGLRHICLTFQRVAFSDNCHLLNASRIGNIPRHHGPATALRNLSVR